MTVTRTRPLLTALTAGLVLLMGASLAQLVDLHDAPNTEGSGIAKTLARQIGPGRTRKLGGETMLRHGWKPIALLAAGVLLALGAGSLRPETPAAAQDVQAELADLLVTDGLTRAELVGLYPALAGVPFQPPACVAGAEMFQSKGA